ncbi:MAG: flagellin FliC [Pusillimonas sp.]|nr:flagellin FliC [Pusillimonas sp.]
MSVINTNYLSLVAQNNLQKSQSSLGTAIERLSSGLRINSAKDDAAGQAIANRMGSQINGLNQAARNANDGISAAQTTEGALNQINDNLQRIRVLTVQAETGTNSSEDLTSIQNEIGQRLDEINRISTETEFNGVKVLSEDQTIKIQVGANDGQSIEINLSQINAQTLGLDGFNIDGSGTTQNRAASVNDVTGAGGTETAVGSGLYEITTTHNAATFDDILGQMSDGNTVSVDGGATEYTYKAGSNSFTYDETIAAGTAADVTALAGELKPSTGTATATYEIAGGDVASFEVNSAGDITIDGQSAYISATGELTTNDAGGTAATLDALLTEMNDAGTATATLKMGGTTYTSTAGAIAYEADASIDDVATALGGAAAASSVTIGSGITSATIAIGAGSTESTDTYVDSEGSLTDVDTYDTTYAVNQNTGEITVDSGTGTGAYEADVGATVYVNSDGELTTETTSEGDRTESPLAALDTALAQVDALRSDLGAIQNRFESAITNLQTTSNNLSSAQSRIQDADYSVEVANMTRAQILQQAGTSVLAQANQIPQGVLSLLG